MNKRKRGEHLTTAVARSLRKLSEHNFGHTANVVGNARNKKGKNMKVVNQFINYGGGVSTNTVSVPSCETCPFGSAFRFWENEPDIYGELLAQPTTSTMLVRLANKFKNGLFAAHRAFGTVRRTPSRKAKK